MVTPPASLTAERLLVHVHAHPRAQEPGHLLQAVVVRIPVLRVLFAGAQATAVQGAPSATDSEFATRRAGRSQSGRMTIGN